MLVIDAYRAMRVLYCTVLSEHRDTLHQTLAVG